MPRMTRLGRQSTRRQPETPLPQEPSGRDEAIDEQLHSLESEGARFTAALALIRARLNTEEEAARDFNANIVQRDGE